MDMPVNLKVGEIFNEMVGSEICIYSVSVSEIKIIFRYPTTIGVSM